MEGHIQQHTAFIGGGAKEGAVYRRAHQHFVAGLGDGVDCHMQSGDDAGSEGDPLLLDLIVVAALHPADDGFIIFIGQKVIAKDQILHSLLQSGHNGRGHSEIHIGDPHGQQVFCHAAAIEGVGLIPLDAALIFTMGSVLKIVHFYPFLVFYRDFK